MVFYCIETITPRVITVTPLVFVLSGDRLLILNCYNIQPPRRKEDQMNNMVSTERAEDLDEFEVELITPVLSPRQDVGH